MINLFSIRMPIQFIEENTVFKKKKVLRQLDSLLQKNEERPLRHTISKNSN